MSVATGEDDCIDCGTHTTEGRRFGEYVLCDECADGYSRSERQERFKEHKREQAREELPDDPDFEDYTEPVGEYGLPAYVDFPEKRRRFAERRAQFLEAEYDLPERFAFALAARQANCSPSWVTDQLGVTQDTVANYYDQMHETDELGFNILLGNVPPEDVETPLDTSGPSKNPRTCPECGALGVMGLSEVDTVYGSMSADMKRAYEAALSSGKDTICDKCYATWTSGGSDPEDSPEVTGTLSRIPDEVQQHPRWMVREGKVPKAPWVTGGVGGLKGGAMNRNGWTNFREAADWANKHPNYGLMFALTTQDDLCVIDLDDVVDDEGNLAPMAREIVNDFDAYTEFSPSGEGIHIVFRGEIPADKHFENIEVYDSGRGMTFTGRVIHSGPVEDRQDELDALADEWATDEDPHDQFYSYDGDYEGGDADGLGEIAVRDVFPELPAETRVDHPVHGSTTGGNFSVFAHGQTGTCFRGTCRHGQGEGCVVNGAHLLGMMATGEGNCGTARKRWREDDEFVLAAYVEAVDRNVDFEFNDVPYRVLRAAAAEVGMDVGADDKQEQARAFDTARMVLRQDYDVPVSDYDTENE